MLWDRPTVRKVKGVGVDLAILPVLQQLGIAAYGFWFICLFTMFAGILLINSDQFFHET